MSSAPSTDKAEPEENKSGVKAVSFPLPAEELIAAIGETEWNAIGDHYGINPLDFQRSISHVRDPGASEVLPQRLWLGNQVEAAYWPVLQACKITHVLNMAQQCDPRFPDKLVYKWVKIFDHAGDAKAFRRRLPEILEFMHDAVQHGVLFVHCQSGISRSSTAVLCYLVRYHGMDYDEAYHYLKGKRHCIKPIPEFRRIVVEQQQERERLERQAANPPILDRSVS